MEWNIEKSHKRCKSCECAFPEGMQYFSALVEEGEQFVRHDFCTECWEKQPGEQQSFSFWRTRIPTREEERKLLVDDNVLLDFFMRLAGEDGEQPDHKVRFKYILALVLMRKKVLRFVDITHQDGKEYLVLRYPREKLDFNVLDPGLTEEEAENVKEDLTQVLNVEV